MQSCQERQKHQKLYGRGETESHRGENWCRRFPVYPCKWKEDPTRYTEPFSTYMENLETFIRVAKDHSAYPVLITPLERRCFMDEKHLGIGAHSDYVAAMKQTAEKNNVPLVDLYSMSRMELKKAGEKNSRRWYMFFPEGEYKNHPEKSEDNTHLRYDGAVNFASLIAKGLKEIGGIYAEMLLDDLKL